MKKGDRQTKAAELYNGGGTMADVARALKCNPSAARQALFRARGAGLLDEDAHARALANLAQASAIAARAARVEAIGTVGTTVTTVEAPALPPPEPVAAQIPAWPGGPLVEFAILRAGDAGPDGAILEGVRLAMLGDTCPEELLQLLDGQLARTGRRLQLLEALRHSLMGLRGNRPAPEAQPNGAAVETEAR